MVEHWTHTAVFSNFPVLVRNTSVSMFTRISDRNVNFTHQDPNFPMSLISFRFGRIVSDVQNPTFASQRVFFQNSWVITLVRRARRSGCVEPRAEPTEMYAMLERRRACLRWKLNMQVVRWEKRSEACLDFFLEFHLHTGWQERAAILRIRSGRCASDVQRLYICEPILSSVSEPLNDMTARFNIGC